MRDVLAEDAAWRAGPPRVRVRSDREVVHRSTGKRGTVLQWHADWVVLRERSGLRHRLTNLPGGFSLDGETVTLAGVDPVPTATNAPTISASGSIAEPEQSAYVARPDRLWVEGDHDARLVERVWGDDLRAAALVVEPLGGLDHLDAAVERFRPTRGRRLAVLADHLVPRTKEWRLTERFRSDDEPEVLVVGHPFVDVWQCVRPASLGIDGWPEVPLDEDWKTGVCDRLGWGEPIDGWRRVLAAVDSYADLEASLVGAVEAALDFLLDEETS